MTLRLVVTHKRGLPVPIDNHWKSLGSGSDLHCHEWQHGAHIESLPKEKNPPYTAGLQVPDVGRRW